MGVMALALDSANAEKLGEVIDALDEIGVQVEEVDGVRTEAKGGTFGGRKTCAEIEITWGKNK